ncbi:Adhesin yadA precursor [Cedecea lapagei]|uniref:Adhesin yadA n=1 Tax=Cedecea lapagei TaxID=158823 RepID=A0A3S4INQ7_9ENTR|nr:YadA-like family protein [Cedecea lapagei]VEB98331.1 Adhesin yadA precursor [Cedecea lapagei]
MKNKIFLSFLFSGLLIGHSATAAEWGDWSSDVTSSNSHADAAKTNGNFGDIKNNVDTIDSTLNESIQKQQAVNEQQQALNDKQDNTNVKQAEWNENQTSLNSQQSAVNQQQSEVNANQATVNGQQDVVNQNQASLNTQQGAINQSQARSNAQFQNSLTQLNGDLNHLSNRVDKLDNRMKRGFASQSALSGLFQPYSVGKFNLSGSLGGYESTSAMAIGSGYRFNENVAAKAGISTNTEDFKAVSYNAAINFEW